MIRRGSPIFSAGLLALIATLWIAATASPWWSPTTSGGASGLTIAAAQKDGWLIMVIVSRDGLVRIRYFEENVTHDQAFSVQAAQTRRTFFRDQPSGILTAKRTSDPVSTSLWFHLLPALIVAFILSMLTIGMPWLKQRLRVRRKQCLRCGYDLRHATSNTCTECGCVNDHITPAKSPSPPL